MEIDELFNLYGIPVPTRNKDGEAFKESYGEVLKESHEVSINPSLTGNSTHTARGISYVQALVGEVEPGSPLIEYPPLRVVGGNIVVMINEEEYDKGVVEFRFSLIRRLVLSKGDKPIRMTILKRGWL